MAKLRKPRFEKDKKTGKRVIVPVKNLLDARVKELEGIIEEGAGIVDDVLQESDDLNAENIVLKRKLMALQDYVLADTKADNINMPAGIFDLHGFGG